MAAEENPYSGVAPIGTAQVNGHARVREGVAGSEGHAKHKKKKTAKFKLEIAHQTHGRVRMKVPSAKGDQEILREIAETFGAIPGIERVTVNPTTGSVTLHYDTEDHAAFHHGLSQSLSGASVYRPPATEFDELANRIEDEAEFLARHSESAKAVVDLKIALAAGIIGLTVFEIGTSAATPVWLTLTIFSLNHIIEMQHPQGSRVSAPAPAPVVFKTA